MLLEIAEEEKAAGVATVKTSVQAGAEAEAGVEGHDGSRRGGMQVRRVVRQKHGVKGGM